MLTTGEMLNSVASKINQYAVTDTKIVTTNAENLRKNTFPFLYSVHLFLFYLNLTTKGAINQIDMIKVCG